MVDSHLCPRGRDRSWQSRASRLVAATAITWSAIAVFIEGNRVFACSCEDTSLRSHYEQADAVLAGSVTGVVPSPRRWLDIELVDVTIEPFQVWKGLVGTSYVVTTFANGSCVFEFVEHGRFIVLPTHVDGMVHPFAGRCGTASWYDDTMAADIQRIFELKRKAFLPLSLRSK